MCTTLLRRHTLFYSYYTGCICKEQNYDFDFMAMFRPETFGIQNRMQRAFIFTLSNGSPVFLHSHGVYMVFTHVSSYDRSILCYTWLLLRLHLYTDSYMDSAVMLHTAPLLFTDLGCRKKACLHSTSCSRESIISSPHTKRNDNGNAISIYF